ncbi:MAG: coat protein [Sanya fiers-like virus 45]|nr:MAG: coat protein [Sanya fiers-like virus 45]
MPQFTKTALPVAQLGNLMLVPMEQKNGVSFFQDATASTPALAPTLSVSLTRPSKTSKLYKVRMKGEVPIPKANPDGTQTKQVDYSTTFDITFISPENSSIASREFARNMLLAALTAFEDSVVSLESVY